MALNKSKAETKGDTLLRVIRRGKASVREAAILLDTSWSTLNGRIGRGVVPSITIGPRQYLTLEMLVEQGLAIPYIPGYNDRVEDLTAGIDSNDDDFGDY